MTHDRDVAFTILFGRLVETGKRTVSAEQVRQAEQAIVDGSFAGSRPAFNAALAKAGANIYVARAAIADEILREQAEAAIGVPAATEAQIQSFYALYPDTLVREFRVKPAAPWLGNRTSGFALTVAAPARAVPPALGDRLPVHDRARHLRGHAARADAPAGRASPMRRPARRSAPRSPPSPAPRRTRTPPASAPSRR